jgi:hypothetical protein
VPIHGRSAARAIGLIEAADLGTRSVTARQPTLDDVYLPLTGARNARAA